MQATETATKGPTKITWRRLIRFSNVMTRFLEREKKDTKFKFAVNRVLSNLADLQPKMDLRFAKLAVDHALEYTEGEKKGAVMRGPEKPDRFGALGPGDLLFSREGTNLLEAARDTVLDEGAKDFTPYFARRVPENIEYSIIEICRGICISDEDADRLIQAIEDKAVDGGEPEKADDKTTDAVEPANGRDTTNAVE